MLGSEYARTFLNLGAKVALLDIETRKFNSAGYSAWPDRLLVLTTDVTDRSQVERAFDVISAAFGAPSILVNNAGTSANPDADSQVNGPFEDFPVDEWDRTLSSHLKGTLISSQCFLSGVRSAGTMGASIINISSTYGAVSPDQAIYEYRRKGGENYFKPVAYSVAKAGVLGFTRWLAEYASPLGVRVNALVLGGVLNGQDPEFVEAYCNRTMLKRMAKPSDYNGAIAFLASSMSEYMTGSVMVIDGGWTAK
jgi:NAD(P)-dependent dehydrogenase (short-subunit alcohol dehydrogenase family)